VPFNVSCNCNLPISQFNVSQQDGFAPFSVTFFDQSTNNPTKWEWSFPGGSPSTSNLQNPTINFNSIGLYNVSLKTSNDCGNNTLTKTNYINVNSTVGIFNNQKNENINVYPNPNNGTFKIDVDLNSSEKVQLKIFSIDGQLVYTSEILPIRNKLEKEISINNIVAGVYIIQLLVEKEIVFKKMVIEK
jgi:PKD repeat protein